MLIPTLETSRLRIRPLEQDDVDACHQLYVDIDWASKTADPVESRERRRSWIEWSVRNYAELDKLGQPPYGDRAVVTKDAGQLIGLIGLVPMLAPFGRLAGYGGNANARYTTEVGLFWAISPTLQGRGFASEAAGTLVAYAFDVLKLERIVAGAEADNAASIGVMRKLGMRIETNPCPEPPWFQVCGNLEAPR